MQLTRGEKETQSAAERLASQVEEALASVAAREKNTIGELDASANRIERAARDLSVALRELAQERERKDAEE